MAGSFGALGADISCAVFNPAGLGRFSRSFAEITGIVSRNVNNSTFNGQETQRIAGKGGISSLGMVITSDISERGYGMLYQQLGFGLNRIESFHNVFHYEGQQYASLLDGFTSQAEGIDPGSLNDYFPFSSNLAYQTSVINYYAPTQTYSSLLNSGDVIHNRTVESNGGQNELFVSYSFNYLNKLYLGASVGFRHHKYQEKMKHSEALTDTNGTPLRSFNYHYDLFTSGWGTNLKFGAIYLFNESFRAGLSLHSPTFGELTDSWSASMSSQFEDSTKVLASNLVPSGNYKYRIRNPIRLIGSVAWVAGTRGCLNLDVELIDYRIAHVKTTKDRSYLPYNYEIENDYARSIFRPALNLRLGGEYILASTIYLRGGLAYYGKAFDEAVLIENFGDVMITNGAGLRTKKFYIDIALKLRFTEKNYYAFVQSITNVKTISGSICLTTGFNL